MTVTMGNIGTAENVIMANVRNDVQQANSNPPADTPHGFGPMGSAVVRAPDPQNPPPPAGLLATGGAGSPTGGPPAGFGPIGAPQVAPAPETPALPPGFGPIGRPGAGVIPEGFGEVAMVSAVELARRYRAEARTLDFDASDRATRLLQRAKDLERGSELIVPDVELD